MTRIQMPNTKEPTPGRTCRFIVVQAHPTAYPDSPGVVSNFLNNTGVMLPLSLDGFYSDFEQAAELAAYLRAEFPKADVYVAEVRSMNGEPF